MTTAPGRTPPASTTSPDPRKSVHIAATVRRQIDDGTLRPGTPVSITTLASQHHVDRETAAKGLRILVGEERLALWPGYGYLVTSTPGRPAPS